MTLTDAELRNLTEPGKHFDGGGLYLELTSAGGRYWRMKYRFCGRKSGCPLACIPA
nr:Arm DNA-binding domain-containing protein [Rhodoferax sp.]